MPAITRLPDSDLWINRHEVHSSTSNRLYVVSQNRSTLWWCCSCPAGRTRRLCKHLKAFGLPHGQPFQPDFPLVYRERRSDVLSGYQTYDTSQGFGVTEPAAAPASVPSVAQRVSINPAAPARRMRAARRTEEDE